MLFRFRNQDLQQTTSNFGFVETLKGAEMLLRFYIEVSPIRLTVMAYLTLSACGGHKGDNDTVLCSKKQTLLAKLKTTTACHVKEQDGPKALQMSVMFSCFWCLCGTFNSNHWRSCLHSEPIERLMFGESFAGLDRSFSTVGPAVLHMPWVLASLESDLCRR